jgi:hypothetical protein
MPRISDFAGMKFGRLTVLHREPGRKPVHWICKCQCGTQRSFNSFNLKTGHTTSCGCYQRENPTRKTHGLTRTQEYKIWARMKGRCNNPDDGDYPEWGGRGIIVCERWNSSFENFLADMGERPTPKHSIDRYPDNDGNYEPTNCRWATSKEQANNRRNCRVVSYRGQSVSLKQAVTMAGTNYAAVQARLKNGWDTIAAIDTPVRKLVRRTPCV